MAFINQKTDNQNVVTVDKELSASLIHHFPKPEFPYQLELRVEKKKFFLDVDRHAPILGLPKIDITWNILQIHGVCDSEDEKKVVQSLVTDALNVYGRNGLSEGVGRITVDFSKANWGQK